MIALIVLVALTLAGIALVRSIGTTNIVAGNLAFQQAASHSSEAGSDAAIGSYLEVSIPADLNNDHLDQGYAASAPAAGDPLAAPTSGNPAPWDTYLATMIDPHPVTAPAHGQPATCSQGVCTLPTDAAGNTVSYSIQRLCANAGDPLLTATGCASGSLQSSLTGRSLSSGSVALPMLTQYYYRITTRTVGPRNTVSYIQTIVAR